MPEHTSGLQNNLTITCRVQEGEQAKARERGCRKPKRFAKLFTCESSLASPRLACHLPAERLRAIVLGHRTSNKTTKRGRQNGGKLQRR